MLGIDMAEVLKPTFADAESYQASKFDVGYFLQNLTTFFLALVNELPD